MTTELSAPAAEAPDTTTPAPSPNAAPQRLRLDDANVKSCYANFANVNSTREETTLMFGMLQAWSRGQSEIPVQINDRIVMSPHVAKRLATMLNNVLGEYEARFGPLGDAPRG